MFDIADILLLEWFLFQDFFFLIGNLGSLRAWKCAMKMPQYQLDIMLIGFYIVLKISNKVHTYWPRSLSRLAHVPS